MKSARFSALASMLAAVVVFGGGVVEAQQPWDLGPWAVDREDGTQPGSQDVYFLDEDDHLRNPDGLTDPQAPLYNIAGAPLDITWGQYQSVQTSSWAIVTLGPSGPTTTFVVNLKGLVPNGVYSLFYATLGPDSENPLCPGVLRDLPVPSVAGSWQQPDLSSFVASRNGDAVFIGRVEGNLLEVTQLSLQVVYHADGRTYHPLPNRAAYETQGANCTSSYGVDAMRQVFILQKWLF